MIAPDRQNEMFFFDMTNLVGDNGMPFTLTVILEEIATSSRCTRLLAMTGFLQLALVPHDDG